MSKFNIDEMQREWEEIESRMKKRQEDGVADILKYFDRIHDNLSNYNNLLIGAFFALAQFQENISRWTILIPLGNLCILIYINYRLMEKARFEADILNKSKQQIDKYGKSIRTTNWLSLFSIVSTATVTGVFLYYLGTY